MADLAHGCEFQIAFLSVFFPFSTNSYMVSQEKLAPPRVFMPKVCPWVTFQRMTFYRQTFLRICHTKISLCPETQSRAFSYFYVLHELLASRKPARMQLGMVARM
ncbi:GQ67_04664T0 [Komagataella phaffii]|nr:GQ67_04664T0 [Komagataella phaffii]AOA69529.1 GQ68_04636T0 [Komagataella phaffii GS115]